MKKIILLLSIIPILFVLGCNQTKPVACTMEAKICPDGSAVGRVVPNCEFAPCPKETAANKNSTGQKHYCAPQQRNAGVCIELYQPVCGWLDPAKIQCVKYPCAQTFSNSCFACMDSKVIYWTGGECPK